MPTPGVVLSALKKAESEDGLVLRFVVMDGRDTMAVVELDPALAAGLLVATPLDLMERPAGAGIALEGTTLTVPVAANGFATYRMN